MSNPSSENTTSALEPKVESPAPEQPRLDPVNKQEKQPKRGGYDRRGAKNPKWKGGIISDGHGRILVYSPEHPFPNWCGTHVYRYRLVMEKVLGRYLLPSEIVHHINGIVDDDRPENLTAMTQSNHCKTHNFGKGHHHAKLHDN